MISGFQCNYLDTEWLVEPSREQSYIEAQCWPLFMVGWVLSSGSSQVSLCEQKSMLLSPCVAAVLASILHCVYTGLLCKHCITGER